MRESLRQFVKGPVWDLILWAGVLGTLVFIAQVVADYGSPWLWVAIWAVLLSAASFGRFHQMRVELERVKSQSAVAPVYIDHREFHGGTHSHIAGTATVESYSGSLWLPGEKEG